MILKIAILLVCLIMGASHRIDHDGVFGLGAGYVAGRVSNKWRRLKHRIKYGRRIGTMDAGAGIMMPVTPQFGGIYG